MWEKIKTYLDLPKTVKDVYSNLNKRIDLAIKQIDVVSQKESRNSASLNSAIVQYSSEQDKTNNCIYKEIDILLKQVEEIKKEYTEIKESLWIQSKQIWALIESHPNKDVYLGEYNKPEAKKK